MLSALLERLSHGTVLKRRLPAEVRDLSRIERRTWNTIARLIDAVRGESAAESS